jgi:Transposase DDE domain group 1
MTRRVKRKGAGCGLRVAFDHRLKLEFHGASVTSDAGLLAFRELDDALGLTTMAAEVLAETRTERNAVTPAAPGDVPDPSGGEQGRPFPRPVEKTLAFEENACLQDRVGGIQAPRRGWTPSILEMSASISLRKKSRSVRGKL